VIRQRLRQRFCGWTPTPPRIVLRPTPHPPALPFLLIYHSAFFFLFFSVLVRARESRPKPKTNKPKKKQPKKTIPKKAWP
jgi:hypothetical protein